MIRGEMNVTLPSLVVSVVSLDKSIHHFISSSPLRMINSLDSSSLKLNAPQPSRMEVNSGKSSHHSLFKPFTLKYNTRTPTECTLTKQNWFQTGHVYSSCLFITITRQFQWSIIEIVTLFIQFSHFNHFQWRHILNLTHRIVIEGITTHLQVAQLRTTLQIEMTIWIITITIPILREAILSNHHSLQLRQPNQMHLIHIHQTIATHYKLL